MWLASYKFGRKAQLRQRKILSESTTHKLSSYLDKPLTDGGGEVSRTHQEFVVCYSYLCHLARVCSEKKSRPTKILVRKCRRFESRSSTDPSELSDFALDVLATHRSSGTLLGTKTLELLDKLRPNGPIKPKV